MFQYRYLTSLDFSSLYDLKTIYLEPCRAILPSSSTQIEETFTSTSGFDKKWMLRHHYALSNRSLSHNESPAVHLFHLKNCLLSDPFFDVIVNDSIVWESFHSSFAYKTWLFDSNFQSYKHIHASSTANVSEPGPFFLAPTRWYNTNYYHWTIDCLPKLLLFKELKSVITGLKLLIHRFPFDSFQSQWLRILEIGDTEITYLREGVNHNIFDVYYVPILGANFVSRLSSQYFKTGFDKYLQKVNYSSSHYPEKIFISRRLGHVRSIANQTEINSLLAAYDFQVIYAEDFSVLDQLKLFTDARYIIGIHGSGLSNLLFTSSSSSILEITPSCVNPAILDLANSLELRYGYIVTPYSPIAKENQLILVNPLTLQDQVNTLLSK